MNELYSEELEQSVLGTILVSKKEQRNIKQLNSNDFYFGKNQTIYNLMKELYEQNKPIDLVSVKELATDKGMEGREIFQYLLKISEYQILILPYYIKKLKNYSTRRKIVEAGKEIIKKANEMNSDEEPAEIKKLALKEISNVKIDNIDLKNNEMTNVMVKTSEELEKRYLKKNENKYNTGFFDLDKITDGLHEQELTIIAARPGLGKTSFAINLAQHIAKRGIYTYFVSLEMSEVQLGTRMISGVSGIDGHKLRKGWLEEKDFEKIGQAEIELAELKMLIDTQSTTVQDIETRAYELKEKKNMGFIIIDYLQLLKSKEKFNIREQEVADISRRLKLLSRDLNIPIVALCQLNRETEKRKRPMLADLRESGAIEQDADNVILLYASEEEKINQFLMEIEVIVAKQRNGPTGVITLKYNKKTMTFQNRS